jgi:hypothetical protein
MRTFCHRVTCRAWQEFSIAALPDGYCYRLGSASMVTFGLVGRAAVLAGCLTSIECPAVRAMAAGRIAGCGGHVAGPTKPASVQWSASGSGLRIGDAALARDALSSQGIATGVSEAILAAAIEGDDDVELIRLRQHEQHQSHMRSLLGILDRCMYADEPLWREYRAFVASQISPEPHVVSAAMRRERVQAIGVH